MNRDTSLRGLIKHGSEALTRIYMSELFKAELEAGSRFATLLPMASGDRGRLFEPDTIFELGRQNDKFQIGFMMCLGQRFLRLMTHPADARAGWHLVPPLNFEIMPLSMIDQEVRFDAFHWALSNIKTGLEGARILESIRFRAKAVLRAPEPRPMLHGLWVKFYDGRCRSPNADSFERQPLSVSMKEKFSMSDHIVNLLDQRRYR